MVDIDFLGKRRAAFKRVFLGTEDGQMVLAHLYKMCGMNKQIHTPGDSHETAFKSGGHRVGQGIQNILAQDEADIMEFLKLSGSGSTNQGGSSYDPYNTGDS